MKIIHCQLLRVGFNCKLLHIGDVIVSLQCIIYNSHLLRSKYGRSATTHIYSLYLPVGQIIFPYFQLFTQSIYIFLLVGTGSQRVERTIYATLFTKRDMYVYHISNSIISIQTSLFISRIMAVNICKYDM